MDHARADAILTGPMLLAALAALLASAPLLVEIPPEPDARVLVEAPLYEALAADVDADGVRDVVVLERGPGSSILVRAWHERAAGTWDQLGDAIEVTPRGAPGDQGNVTWPGTPIRLLVRQVDGGDRVTLLRQPRYEEPNLLRSCCLLLHDVAFVDGRLTLSEVATPADSVRAMYVLVLDGDGTDELVGTRSVPPLGDLSYPTDVFVHRWNGSRFDVTLAELPIGSGDTAVVLGDTDGRPGEELGIAATLGRPELHRISAGPDGGLTIEDAGLAASWAVGIPSEAGGGVVALARDGSLVAARWPAGGAFERVSTIDDAEAVLVGLAGPRDNPLLVVRLPGEPGAAVLSVPDLAPADPPALPTSPAALRLRGGPAPPFIGLVPRGDARGRPVLLAGGVRVDHDGIRSAPAFGGARPIGLVGADLSTMAILHAPGPTGVAAHFAARLDPPVLTETAVSLVPLDLLDEDEGDEGMYEPRVRGGVSVGEDVLVVGPRGFAVEVVAPRGSRVRVAGTDPSVAIATLDVGGNGTRTVPMPPPPIVAGNARYRAVLTVTTPAGASYVAAWDVEVLVEPPRLDASAETQLGSAEVAISGSTEPYASVTVAGRRVTSDETGGFRTTVDAPPWPTEIDVVAVDPIGNESRIRLTGIGWLDWRALPWIPFVVVLVGAAAIVLFLRVPRSKPVPATDDGAVLEELDES